MIVYSRNVNFELYSCVLHWPTAREIGEDGPLHYTCTSSKTQIGFDFLFITHQNCKIYTSDLVWL